MVGVEIVVVVVVGVEVGVVVVVGVEVGVVVVAGVDVGVVVVAGAGVGVVVVAGFAIDISVAFVASVVVIVLAIPLNDTFLEESCMLSVVSVATSAPSCSPLSNIE